MNTLLRLFIPCLILAACSGHDPSLTYISVPYDSTTFWAVSAVDDHTAWVVGSKGTIGQTKDGGRTWAFHRVPGFEQLEFRSVYAHNDLVAVVANVGSPAHILRTSDGGKSWKQVYRNDKPDAFIDGVDFWNEQEGLMYGDPIDGRMLLIRTTDGGKTWIELPYTSRPALEKGEASFASSGTGLRCYSRSVALIATGGLVSRVFMTVNKGESWSWSEPILHQGSSTGGVFSITGPGGNNMFVGGDFSDSTVTEFAAALDDRDSLFLPAVPPKGTRWCVEYIGEKTAVAVGPSGGDITRDGGRTWYPLFNDRDLHVVRKSRKGELIVVAGGRSKLALLR
jgi:photosystem II stability/assembly factor-like uncharacterized protein